MTLVAAVEEDVRPENRYGLYVFDTCPECGGSGVVPSRRGKAVSTCQTCNGGGAALQRIAETSREGIGLALVTLEEDRRKLEDPGNPVIGVLDQQERRWLSGVWQRGR
jgi:hypothetical protein